MDSLVIVAGPPRTGTSLMMQCLRNSGYNIGRKRDLGGGFFICEHKRFNAVNKLIARKSKLSDEKARGFLKYIHKHNITALKTYAPAVSFWLKYEPFANAKYIRTIRDVGCILDSLIARRKAGTRAKAGELYDQYMTYLKRLNDYEHIFVKYEDVLMSPQTEWKRIADFLGIKYFSLDNVKKHLWRFRPHDLVC